ncbi:MAG: substrate-binding periplasmic protein [Pseudomonadota bacterium]
MPTRTINAIAFILAALCGLPKSALSQEPDYRFAALPPVEYKSLNCGTNEFPPFGYERNGQAQGVEVDLAREIGRRLGIDISVDIYPWPRLLKMIENGQLDCMFAAFYTDERERYMTYTRMPVHVSRLALYTRRGETFEFDKLADLKGKRLGILRDFKTVPVLDERLNGNFAETTYGKDFGHLFDLLLAGRIDVVIVNDDVARHIINTRELDQVVELPYALSSNSAFITFSKARDYSHLIPKVEYALFEMMAEGMYREVFERHSKGYYRDGSATD